MTPSDVQSDSQKFSQQMTIVNLRGLHARASAKFVRLAEQFDAEINVTKDTATVGATSIMGLMMLAASLGTTISLSATGRDAEKALQALAELIASGFDEDTKGAPVKD